MRGVKEEGWRFVAFVRLVPLFPFNLMDYACGLTRIRLAEYVVASFVCVAPGAIDLHLSGLRGARGHLRTRGGNLQGSAGPGSARSRRFSGGPSGVGWRGQ
jgi:SNARE associated Golgi protein